MKKVFTNEYPNEHIDEVSKWLDNKLNMREEKNDGSDEYMYRATVIVEIIPNN